MTHDKIRIPVKKFITRVDYGRVLELLIAEMRSTVEEMRDAENRKAAIDLFSTSLKQLDQRIVDMKVTDGILEV